MPLTDFSRLPSRSHKNGYRLFGAWRRVKQDRSDAHRTRLYRTAVFKNDVQIHRRIQALLHLSEAFGKLGCVRAFCRSVSVRTALVAQASWTWRGNRSAADHSATFWKILFKWTSIQKKNHIASYLYNTFHHHTTLSKNKIRHIFSYTPKYFYK